MTVAPSFLQQLLAGHHGAAGGDQVVDQQHARRLAFTASVCSSTVALPYSSS
jgi:hypothetical protein